MLHADITQTVTAQQKACSMFLQQPFAASSAAPYEDVGLQVDAVPKLICRLRDMVLTALLQRQACLLSTQGRHLLGHSRGVILELPCMAFTCQHCGAWHVVFTSAAEAVLRHGPPLPTQKLTGGQASDRRCIA